MFAQKWSLPQVKVKSQSHWTCLKRCCFSCQSKNGAWQWQVKSACVHLATILLYALKRPLLTQLRKVLCTSLEQKDWLQQTELLLEKYLLYKLSLSFTVRCLLELCGRLQEKIQYVVQAQFLILLLCYTVHVFQNDCVWKLFNQAVQILSVC